LCVHAEVIHECSTARSGSGSFSASSLGHLSNFGIGVHDASLTLYVKVAQAGGEETIVQWSGDDLHAGIRLLRSAQRFVFQTWPGGAPLHSTSFVVPNTWYHIAVTKTDQTIILYVNGAVEDRQPAPLPFNGLNRPVTLGGNTAGRGAFRGWLDEVGLYSRALTAKEVWDLYQLRESGPCRP
jgi:Concanavalin A-like lectin/glucanases superfamily